MVNAHPTGGWFIHGPARPGRLRLICFPHGGGAPAEFARWSRRLPGVEISAVQLPGRGSRLSEPVLTRMGEVVAEVAEVLPTDAPYAVFGHSLGALMGYEVTRQLRRTGRRLPEQLIVSGFPAPSTPRTEPPIHHLPDDDLLTEVAHRHGGLPTGILDDPERKATVARYLRADYQILETYEWRADAPLPVPLTAFGGREDTIGADALRAWRAHVTGEIDLRCFPGGHFYFRQHQAMVLRALATVTRTAVPGDRAA
ncbi:alpha/beta fold hydrolase [Amycolatopsis sp. OK19-0408]|uniref:Alpha/beta fold hydrolase n=1 Tax=Amycolatopsis iheyensis TaxID=2945988 RepID=A0A9X2NA81_9PSEU|nr:alpha/beta fold hydrolase [Amycolatopsis iheyensis]MCR6483483.1 alpha/beta fold hydrolase [Amycolatopsis iheyensis]